MSSTKDQRKQCKQSFQVTHTGLPEVTPPLMMKRRRVATYHDIIPVNDYDTVFER